MLTSRLFSFSWARCVAVAVAALSLQFAAGATWAQTASKPAQGRAVAGSSEELVLQVYDVGDLVFNVPDYPYSSGGGGMSNVMGPMGGMGGMGGGMGMGGGIFNVEDAAGATEEMEGRSAGPSAGIARITIDDLQRVVTTMVAPATWDRGHIQSLGHALIVRQTPEVHEQISDLLYQLRRDSRGRRTVTVDARWLVLDSADLDRLVSRDNEGRSTIDRAVLEEFTRRPTSIRGLTNCFSGQLVYLVGGTRQNFVSGYIPVVGSAGNPEEEVMHLASVGGGAHVAYVQGMGTYAQGMGGTSGYNSRPSSVGYQPVIEKTNFGTLLEIRPTLIPGSESAVVDLRSTVTTPGGPTSVGGPEVGGVPVPRVDRFAMETQEFATTLSMPLGRPVLVGGLTYVTSMTAGNGNALPVPGSKPHASKSPDNGETPQLYLVLELQ